MAVDQSLVGRGVPAHEAVHRVRGEGPRVRRRDRRGVRRGPAPATFPIVLAFDAMFAFLDAESIDLFRIVHGDQKFTYERAVVPGDVLSATLTVASLRQIGGNDIIGTTSRITDSDGALVCATSATLVHRGADA